jgi:hypothetical protein
MQPISISNCPATGKKRKVVSVELKQEADGNFTMLRAIEYFENDGETKAIENSVGLSRELFAQKELPGTTSGSFINPITKQFTSQSDPEGIPEADFYRSIPISSLPAGVTTLGDVIDYMIASSIQIADLNNKF